MKRNIEDLYDVLFETLNDLRSKDSPMNIERARAITNTAQTLINIGKLEVQALRATGKKQGSGFFTQPPIQLEAPHQDREALPAPTPEAVEVEQNPVPAAPTPNRRARRNGGKL